MELKFIDCNCSFGILRANLPYHDYDKNVIKNELSRVNVVKAIVSHSTQREYDALYGTKRLLEEIKGDDFFIPTMSMIPFNTEEHLTLSETDEFIDKNKIKLINLYPSAHNYSPVVWNMKEIYDYLSDKGLPVLLSKTDVSMEILYNILSEFPKLKIIYTDTGYASDRTLMTLMKKFDNLYIDTGTYYTLDGIEYITNKFGAERLVFGSNMPFTAVGASVGKIIFSKISDSDKEKIAYKNICNIIGEDLLI